MVAPRPNTPHGKSANTVGSPNIELLAIRGYTTIAIAKDGSRGEACSNGLVRIDRVGVVKIAHELNELCIGHSKEFLCFVVFLFPKRLYSISNIAGLGYKQL